MLSYNKCLNSHLFVPPPSQVTQLITTPLHKNFTNYRTALFSFALYELLQADWEIFLAYSHIRYDIYLLLNRVIPF
jgi:hypothetical protein